MFRFLKKNKTKIVNAEVTAHLIQQVMNAVWPNHDPRVVEALKDNIDILIAGGCNSKLRLAHFLAQACVETAGFRYLQELGGHSYFTRMYDKTGQRPHVARTLGNTQTGDGARYHGRGFMMTTGRYNYTQFSQAVGIDYIAEPELLAQPRHAVKSAVFYWQTKKLWAVADKGPRGDIVKVISKIVNGGYNHLQERKAAFLKLSKALDLGKAVGKPITRTKTTGAAGGILALTGLNEVTDPDSTIVQAVRNIKDIKDIFNVNTSNIDWTTILICGGIAVLAFAIIYDRRQKSLEDFT